MTATAHCLACPWTAEGAWADVDSAAAKHVSPGHATATIATRRNP